MTMARIIWIAGTIAYILWLLTRLAGSREFYIDPNDAIVLLLIAGVAQLVWAEPQRPAEPQRHERTIS